MKIKLRTGAPTEWVRLRRLAAELIVKQWGGKTFSAIEFGRWVRETRKALQEDRSGWHLFKARDAMQKQGLLLHMSGKGGGTIWRMP